MSTPRVSHEQPEALIKAAGEAFANWRKRRKIGRLALREQMRDEWIAELLASIPGAWWDMWPAHEQHMFCNEVYAIQLKFDNGDRDLPGSTSLPTTTETTCSTTLYRMRRSVCRIRYIVGQIAHHFPADERPAVDVWFHDGFLAHMSVAYWDSLGAPFGPDALHALVAVKEFESVLEKVEARSVRSPAELPDIGHAVHFPALHRLMTAFERLHPEHAESSEAAVKKRQRRDRSGSDDDPAQGGLKRRATDQELAAAAALVDMYVPRHNTRSLAHVHAQRVELSLRQRARYGKRWAGV